MKLIFCLGLCAFQGLAWAESSNRAMSTAVEIISCYEGSKILGSYEMEVYGRPQGPLPGAGYPEKVDLALEALSPLVPEFLEDLQRSKFSQVRESLKFVPNNIFSEIEDSEFTSVPNNCQLRQLIVSSNGGYLVSLELWGKLSQDDQARALLQLAIYNAYRHGDYEAYQYRVLAQAFGSGHYLKENILSLPNWGFYRSLQYVYSPTLTLMISHGWSTMGVWNWNFGIGQLFGQIQFGKEFTFIGETVREFKNVNGYRKEGRLGTMTLQGKVFQIDDSMATEDNVILRFYSTGELCGFFADHTDTLNDEAGISRLVLQGNWVYINKSGTMVDDQINHVCE